MRTRCTLRSSFAVVATLAIAPAVVLGDAIPADSPVAPALRRADATVQRIVAVSDDRRTFDNTIGALDDIASKGVLGAASARLAGV